MEPPLYISSNNRQIVIFGITNHLGRNRNSHKLSKAAVYRVDVTSVKVYVLCNFVPTVVSLYTNFMKIQVNIIKHCHNLRFQRMQTTSAFGFS